MLKILWDYVHLVRSSIEDWKLTQWESINVEQMDMDCKKFAKVHLYKQVFLYEQVYLYALWIIDLCLRNNRFIDMF